MSFLSDVWDNAINGGDKQGTCGNCGKRVSASNRTCPHCSTNFTNSHDVAAESGMAFFLSALLYPLRNLPSFFPAWWVVLFINVHPSMSFETLSLWIIPINIILILVLTRFFWALLGTTRKYLAAMQSPLKKMWQVVFYSYLLGSYVVLGGYVGYRASEGSLVWMFIGLVIFGLGGMAVTDSEMGLFDETKDKA